MYADDLILISASIIDLQSMLQICNETAKDLGINFNPTKSVGFQIGPNVILQPSPLVISNLNLPWIDKVDYLGITLSKAKYFLVDLSKIRAKFYSTVYSILSKCNTTSEMVKLKLLESHCLPILLYAVESLNLPCFQIKELNACWNSVYRKIFKYQRWESVKTLICTSGRLDLHRIINQKSLSFIINLSNNDKIPDILSHYSMTSHQSSKHSTF